MFPGNVQPPFGLVHRAESLAVTSAQHLRDLVSAAAIGDNYASRCL
jgi:hypothetical protein